MDSFLVEKALLSSLSRKSWSLLADGFIVVQDLILGGTASVLKLALQPIHFKPIPVFENVAIRALYGSIRALLALAVGALQQVARWAGGELLPPSHVLLISGSYAVLSRSGVKGWAAALWALKLLSCTVDKPPSTDPVGSDVP